MIISIGIVDELKRVFVVDFNNKIEFTNIDGRPDSVDIQAGFIMSEFMELFPDAPDVNHIFSLSYEPENDIYHVHYTDDSFKTCPQGKGDHVMEWIKANSAAIYSAGYNNRRQQLGLSI